MKGLECLKRIDTKNYLTEREHRDFYSVVEKSLKALEIIKEKNVDIVRIKISNTAENYNRVISYMGPYNLFMPHLQELTEEEFDLLKEMLE